MPTVQDQIAQDSLQQFHIPLNINLIKKSTDWQFRQKAQYNAELGLIVQDFHGLKDFNLQMSMYSSSNFILSIAFRIIKFIIPNNPIIRSQLITSSLLGSAGRFLTSIQGFSNIFSMPISLTNGSNLKTIITSLQ